MPRTPRAKPSPSVAVAYIRVSTNRQELGPEAQREAIDAWAVREGVHVAAWCEDRGVSGATPVEDRPALLAALGALREFGAGHLVVAKRDRLARDVVIAAVVERLARASGAHVTSAAGEANGSSDADALMRSILAAFSQYERALIRSRTKAALQVKRARGEALGAHAPLGYRVGSDGKLEPEPRERDTIAAIVAWRADGDSAVRIAAQLNADLERFPPRGKRWHATTVARALTAWKAAA